MSVLTPHEVAVALEACAYAAVRHDDDWPILRHGVVIGEIAWDSCECGQLVIAEQRRFPASVFPLEDVQSVSECNEPWLVVQYVISLTRCVAVSDEAGNPPSVALLAASAAQNSADMTALRRAILCCLSAHFAAHEVAAYQLGAQEVTGPGGRCAGSDLTILVGWVNDCECS